jgi:ribonuclease Z
VGRGASLLVCESTFLGEDADKAHAYGHLTAAQAATIARDAGVEQLVLTHFSQRYADVAAFVAEAAPIFPRVVAARDGETIAMSRRQRATS